MEAKAALIIKDYEDPKLWAALEELEKQGSVKPSTAWEVLRSMAIE